MTSSHDLVRSVVSRVLGIENETEINAAQMGNHAGWDSMRHIQIVMAIEKQFEIRFQSFEIPRLVDVNTIAEAVARHEMRRTT